MCSSAIITGIYAIDLYREYRNKEYIDKINNLEKQCESLKKELESSLVVKQVLEETDEIVNINELDLDIQDSEPSPYGSCEEDGEEDGDDDNTDEALLNSESDTSVEELSVSNVIENNEESTESV
tara:strand:+ start:1169 stop:1543 length:375 start_codon:yes stop_codon:yes gene_type:complete